MTVQELDAAVLRVIRQLEQPSEPEQLIEMTKALRLGDITDVAVLRALWRLIDEKKAQLTPERRVRAIA